MRMQLKNTLFYEDSGSNHRPTFGIDQELTNRHAWGGMDHLYPCILECWRQLTPSEH